MDQGKEIGTFTIGVYSGLPDPQLPLGGDALRDLAKLARAAIGHESTHPAPPPRLGYYHGFRVRLPEALAKELELPGEFGVYLGVLTEGSGREQRHWRDVGGIERLLIEEAYRQGLGEVLERAGVERPASST